MRRFETFETLLQQNSKRPQVASIGPNLGTFYQCYIGRYIGLYIYIKKTNLFPNY